jgi:hypothetical protein
MPDIAAAAAAIDRAMPLAQGGPPELMAALQEAQAALAAPEAGAPVGAPVTAPAVGPQMNALMRGG